jgi:hypothetical protein
VDSTGVKAIRENEAPPSVETRATQPPPATSVLASSACNSVRLENVPAGVPVQVSPPSAVFSSVPKSPTA